MDKKIAILIERFIRDQANNFRLRGKQISPWTIKARVYDLKEFFNFVQKEPEQVTQDDVREYLLNLRYNLVKNNTYNRKLTSLRVFFKWAHEQGIIDPLEIKPTEPFKTAPIEKTETIYLPMSKFKDYVRVVAVVCNEPYRTMLLFIPLTGLRVSECIELTFSDLIEKNHKKYLRVVGKGSKVRIIPLIRQADRLLNWYLHKYRKAIKYVPFIRKWVGDKVYETQYIFVTKRGEKVIYQSLYKQIQKVKEVFGMPNLTIHKLRHTFSSYLYQLGVDLKIIQELLGHSSIQTTSDIYVHVPSEKLEEAVEKLEDIFK
ncbi:MAG: tyrosine-type recombinase/integrase [Candidatus Desulfofervidus auxilii]|nr:tyrosine-type recombinase/integrase [Candidatus Desulfofervidus auxilii]